ncbi:hypothetical protein CCR91_11910 [Thiorhodovibrio winogradskyi]|nr:hypothetical protein [Thiorhodovibrio winogradskyi]
MAYTLEDFVRETDEMVLENALKRDPEAILRRFDPEQRLKGLDPDEVLGRFDPDLIEAWLKKQRRDH